MRRIVARCLAAALAASCVWMGAGVRAANPTGSEHQTISRGETVLVKSAQTTVRSAPKSGSKKVTSLTRFEPVKVLKRTGGYVEVQTDNGKKGYVAGKDLTGNPFVTVAGKMANIRSGPGGNDPILFRVYAHYPLKVLEKKGRRLHVKDYEGDEGWVYDTLVSTKPYVIVSLPQINVRDMPGLDAKGQPLGKRRFVAEKSVIFEVLEEKDGWLKIKHADGDVGWCSGNIVWGYQDGD